MSYRPGNMGTVEGAALAFAVGITPVFLSVWSIVLERAATGAWLTPLITGPVLLAALLAVFHVMARVPGDLHGVAEALLGVTAARLVTLYLAACFFTSAVLQLRQFAENTLLTALPATDITLAMGWYGLAVAVAVFTGIEALARAARLVLPAGMLLLFVGFVALTDRFDIHNVMPWQGSGLTVVWVGLETPGLFLATFVIPLLAPSFQDIRTMKKAALIGIGLATAVRSSTLFVYTGIFSVAVGQEKVLPFFELTRLVYLTRFIQRVESFFILIWVFAGMTMIAVNLYLAAFLLARLFALPSLRPLAVPLVVVAIQTALLIPDLTTAIEISLRVEGAVQTAGIYAIPTVLIAALYTRKREGRAAGG
ncbi:MAG: GerAB/ArcD/ProY family transporter [Sporomusaceae bacterium]|nr:GerAB/ArcD/ProY family transporter [Sporomusaceae bacterium]